MHPLCNLEQRGDQCPGLQKSSVVGMILDANQFESCSLNRTGQPQWPARIVRGWIDVRAEAHIVMEIAHSSATFQCEIALNESVSVHYMLYTVGWSGADRHLKAIM